MNKYELIKMILNMSGGESMSETFSYSESEVDTFLIRGKIYAVRTVTMIYTGKLKAINEQEFLFESCAWIPETERWADFAKDGSHKEAEPYTNDVVISRGAILDVTEISKLVTAQK